MDLILDTLTSEGILTLTLNRPDKLNALNEATLLKLNQLLTQAKEDTQVKGLLITGKGRAFCAGADIQALVACDALTGYEFACFGQAVFQNLERLGKPSIALIHGVALGGGCELMQAATLRIAVSSAKFGQPEVKLGVIPGYGGTQRLARLIGKGRALDLCLTGRMIDAHLALSWGLLTQVVEEEEALFEAGKILLLQMLQMSPLGLTSVMDVIQRGYDLPLDEALHLEALQFSKLCATQDKREGVEAFLEKRPPVFRGA